MDRMDRMKRTWTIGLLLTLLVACDHESTTRLRKKGNDNTAKAADEVITCTDMGSSYTGFLGTKLEDGRVKSNIGTDRARVKPYTALRAEYERVLGVAPAGIETAGPSFGLGSARYSTEPRASAIQVYASFRLAFDGCLSYVGNNPELAAEPITKESASVECAAMARTFWSRKASAEEIDACTQVAVVDSASEGATDRRWAYTCASLLSSAGFLTY